MLFGAVLSAGLWGGPFLRSASQELAAIMRPAALKTRIDS
jgi:hypothetical protein